MIYLCLTGKLTMIRYLITRGADGRTTDNSGASPTVLRSMEWSFGDCSVPISTRSGISPLRITLRFEHLDVAPWLILNETLSSPREGWCY